MVNESTILSANDGAVDDLFGTSVAIDGNVAIVGSVFDDDKGDGSGSAYIYRRECSSSLWVQEAKLVASDGAVSDHFGISVDINGDLAIVGAEGVNVPGVGAQAGAAYIYRFNGTAWIEETKLTAAADPEATPGDFFGHSVSINRADVILSGGTSESLSNIAVVGATLSDAGGIQSGSVYTFIDNGGGNWLSPNPMKLVASSRGAGDAFGISLATSPLPSTNGLILVVGAEGYTDPLTDDLTGSACILFWVPIGGGNPQLGSWFESGFLEPPAGIIDGFFGHSVDVMGAFSSGVNTVVIGAPVVDNGNGNQAGTVYVYEIIQPSPGAEPVWTLRDSLTASNGATEDFFGKSVSIFDDTIAIGAPQNNDMVGGPPNIPGQAYLYRRSLAVPSQWNESVIFQPSDGVPLTDFGNAVAISGDTLLSGGAGTPIIPGMLGKMYSLGIGDCNANGIEDACDIASGISTDCNTNGIPDECDIIPQLVDIVFIIDGSGSVFDTVFQDVLDGIKNCLCGPNAIVTTDCKYSVAVIQFSSNQIVEIPRTIIDSPATVQSLCNQVDGIFQVSSTTLLVPALEEAQNIFNQGFNENRILMISTDGGLQDLANSNTTCTNLRNMDPPVKICTALIDTIPCPAAGNSAYDFMQSCANTPESSAFNPDEPIGSYDCIVDVTQYDPLCVSCLVPFNITGDCNGNGILDSCDIANDPLVFDCNENGIPDSCDIASGFSLDEDGDGRPDECIIPPCPADITPPGGNGTVNIDDLVEVLSQFGPCPAPPLDCTADLTPPGGNGVVNIDDLVALLAAFGPCPQAAQSGSGSGATGLTLEAMDFSNGFVLADGSIDAASSALVAGEWLTFQNQWDVYRLWATVDSPNATLTFAGGGVASGIGGTSEPLVLSPGKNAQFFIPVANSYDPVNLGLLAIDGGPGLEWFQTQAFKTFIAIGSATGAGPMKFGDPAGLDAILTTGAVNDPNAGWGIAGSVPSQNVVPDGAGGWRILIGQFAVPEGSTFTAAVRIAGDGVDTYATISTTSIISP